MGIVNLAWGARSVPEDLQKAIEVPIWKGKVNTRDCQICQGISILSHVGKMYGNILESRMRSKVEFQLSTTMFGFRKGRG